MKNLKLIVLSLGLVCLSLTGYSQTYAEGAFLLSNTNPGGTARIQGLGGAQIALGGDVSLAGSNPAGLGMSNRSSITFTLGMLSNNTSSTFYGNTTNNGKYNLNVPQVGLIINKPSMSDGPFRGGSVAINFSRISSYHNRMSYRATLDPNSPEANSIVDYFLEDVDGSPLSDFDEGGYHYNSPTGLGWFTYLIDTMTVDIDGQPTLVYDSYMNDYPSNQAEEITTRGSQSQWSFSYGGNYDDKIFFGVGMNMINYRYRSEKNYEELFNSNDINFIRLDEELFIRGTGMNLSLGMIVRPIDLLQVGVAYTSPTIYNVNDDWQAFISTGWNDFSYPSTGDILGQIDEQTDLLISDYRLTSPARLSVGATAFLGNMGFVTVDYESKDYSKARLRSNDFSMSYDNDEIDAQYTKTNTVRAGVELRYEIFRFRAGGALSTSPYTNDDDFNNLDRSVKMITGGIGIRSKEFFADLSVVHSSTQSLYYPYIINGINNDVTTDIKNVTGLISVGFNF